MAVITKTVGNYGNYQFVNSNITVDNVNLDKLTRRTKKWYGSILEGMTAEYEGSSIFFTLQECKKLGWL